jgi:hypothetical protein
MSDGNDRGKGAMTVIQFVCRRYQFNMYSLAETSLWSLQALLNENIL